MDALRWVAEAVVLIYFAEAVENALSLSLCGAVRCGAVCLFVFVLGGVGM